MLEIEEFHSVLKRHDRRLTGVYSAGTASIGRAAGGSRFFDSDDEIPLYTGNIKTLESDLITFHEAIHFAQYTSSTFGVSHFRSANYALGKFLPSSRDGAADERKISAGLRALTYYREQLSDKKGALNAATLFEGFAFAAELSFIIQSIPNFKDPASFIERRIGDVDPVYSWSLLNCLENSAFPFETILLTHAALIDIALMASPNRLAHELNPSGRFLHPVDYFSWACEAACDVVPIRSVEEAELQRFQDDVCRAMNLHSTNKIAQILLENIQDSTGIDIADRGAAMVKMIDHQDVGSVSMMNYVKWLTTRVRWGDGYFGALTEPFFIRTVFREAGLEINLFDVDTRQPESFGNPYSLIPAVMGGIADEIARTGRPPVECPLKHGRPFYCPSAGSGNSCQTLVEVNGRQLAHDCPASDFLSKSA